MIARSPNLWKPWEPFTYHSVQAQLWSYTGQFAAVVAGRGSGKTEICRRKIILHLPIKKPWPDPLYFYVLPTYNQAKKVAWDPIVRMIPPEWIPRNGFNRTDLSITTVFGSKLYIVGADKPERIEGVQADMVIIDESSDQKPGLFERTVVPMLTHRKGICYRIGVPKRHGIGKLSFREFFNKGLNREDGVASFFWKSAEVIDPEVVEAKRRLLDPVDFAEQFEAEWIDVGSSVYYNFTSENIRDDVKYDPTQEIVVGCDFNVDPMCWTLGHFIDSKLYIFDEIFLKDTNTPSALDHLFNKYYQHLAGWKFFGDASSRSRKTSATRSDYMIIKNDARFGQKKVFFPYRNPNVRDRVAAVNLSFKNAAGEIRCYVNYTCKKLINDINSVAYEEGTSEIENYRGTDIGHMSDALGYVIHSLMPIKVQPEVAPVVHSMGAY